MLLGYVLLFGAGLMTSALTPSGEFQVVCLGNGGRALVNLNLSVNDDHGKAGSSIGDDGDVGSPSSGGSMHCPLAGAIVLPIHAGFPASPPSALEHATRPAVVARLIALAGPALPPRGPPSGLTVSRA